MSESKQINERKLLMAGFLALVAAGIGFAVRGGLLSTWSKTYGFTFTELGQITGGGLLGFGLVILLTGMVIDKVGYKKLLLIALVCHVISAVMLFFATPVFNSSGKDATYQILFWSSFIFAVGNGICEGVINPLTADLYPKQKTHYLNILHAGWPGGLVLGGLIALLVGGGIAWEILLALYLVPAAVYGYYTVTEEFPKTAAQSGAISYAGMFKKCLVPFFIFLVIVHAMVGYVELGTDSWISKITGSILESESKGLMLFIYASTLMFILRFFAGPIVHRISSLGLLFVSAILGALGLYLIGSSSGAFMMILAVTIYGVGKTFLWPTMLGVVGERFPTSATLAMSILGCAGMVSAGLFGGPGIGYKQDRFASEALQKEAPETFKRVKADDPNGFLFFKEVTGLNGQKVAAVTDYDKAIGNDKEIAQENGTWESEKFAKLREMDAWWEQNKEFEEIDATPVAEAGLVGSRSAIKVTAFVPLVMAVCFFLMILGFRSKGGYLPISGEEASGGVQGPVR
ncbi:MAG: MFS family permease [Akkermansiaceae bacterium]|jgi:MFS family permease